MSVSDEKDKGFDLDLLEDAEPSALPIGPSGPLASAFDTGKDPEAATDANMICLRGPCRFLVAIITKFETTNELEHPVRQHNRWCSVIQGDAIELTEMTVFDCNKWDPENPDSDEEGRRQNRRELYQIRKVKKNG